MIFVAFLFPLTLYFLILALVNGRKRPLMVSGPWDFAGVLFAASGFLLAGGPSVLTGLDERWRLFWLLGRPNDLADLADGGWYFDLFLSAGYFLLVLVGATVFLWLRRRQTSIYNVEPEAMESVLDRTLTDLGVVWSRKGRLYWGGDGPLLELDQFPAVRHSLVRWKTADADLRRQVEDGLREGLAQIVTEDNPAASWFFWLGTLLFLIMFGILGLLVTLTILVRP